MFVILFNGSADTIARIAAKIKMGRKALKAMSLSGFLFEVGIGRLELALKLLRVRWDATGPLQAYLYTSIGSTNAISIFDPVSMCFNSIKIC